MSGMLKAKVGMLGFSGLRPGSVWSWEGDRWVDSDFQSVPFTSAIMSGIVGEGTPENPWRVGTYKDAEDMARSLLDQPEGYQALVYKTLYAAGHRIDKCDKAIRDYEKSFT